MSKKKLPGVFPGNVKSTSDNNDRVVYADKKKTIKGENINKKINNIFTSSNYVYKADVTIKLKDGTCINEKVIGKNKSHLITMTGSLIPISDILDIYVDN